MNTRSLFLHFSLSLLLLLFSFFTPIRLFPQCLSVYSIMSSYAQRYWPVTARLAMEMRKREGTLSLEEEAAVEQGIKLIESGKFPKVPHPVMKLYYFLIARPRRAIFYPSTIPITSKRRNLAGFGESMVTATHVARGDLFEVHSQVTGEVGTLMLVRRRRI